MIYRILATKKATTIPTSVAPNISSTEIMNDCKDYRIINKASKGKSSRGSSKKQRKTLLQVQQEVLEKNGKNNANDNVRDTKEGSKNQSNSMDDGDIGLNIDLKSATSGALGPIGSHPRNRWRCMQPRVCNYCWKTFSNSFNLKQHIVNVHVQSQGVACSLCEKVVKNKWYLRKHLVTAHGAPLKRIKGNESNGGAILGARETIVPQNTEIASKQAINKQTESIDAAAAVAAAAAAANIPLASFVAAANSISQQQNNINNNNSTSGVAPVRGSGHMFPFSHASFAPDSNINGNVIGIPDINGRQRLSRLTSSNENEMKDEEEEEEDDEELIVDS